MRLIKNPYIWQKPKPMCNTKIFKGKLPQNLHPENREVAVIIADDKVSLLTHTIAAPSGGSAIVADDVVFLVPLAEEKKESECICVKIGDKWYCIDLSNPKKPKIEELMKG